MTVNRGNFKIWPSQYTWLKLMATGTIFLFMFNSFLSWPLMLHLKNMHILQSAFKIKGFLKRKKSLDLTGEQHCGQGVGFFKHRNLPFTPNSLWRIYCLIGLNYTQIPPLYAQGCYSLSITYSINTALRYSINVFFHYSFTTQ